MRKVYNIESDPEDEVLNADEDSGEMTPDEVEAVSQSMSGIQQNKLSSALECIISKFGLDDSFSVMGYKDGGNRVDVSVANSDFELTVRIRDCDKLGIHDNWR